MHCRLFHTWRWMPYLLQQEGVRVRVARFKFGVFNGLIDTSSICKSDLSSATPQQPVWIGV